MAVQKKQRAGAAVSRTSLVLKCVYCAAGCASLEVQPHRELPESPLVVVGTFGGAEAQAALLSLDHHWQIRTTDRVQEVGLVSESGINVHIDVVENVVRFGPEFERETFRQEKALSDSEGEVPGARAIELGSSGHTGR